MTSAPKVSLAKQAHGRLRVKLVRSPLRFPWSCCSWPPVWSASRPVFRLGLRPGQGSKMFLRAWSWSEVKTRPGSDGQPVDTAPLVEGTGYWRLGVQTGPPHEGIHWKYPDSSMPLRSIRAYRAFAIDCKSDVKCYVYVNEGTLHIIRRTDHLPGVFMSSVASFCRIGVTWCTGTTQPPKLLLHDERRLLGVPWKEGTIRVSMQIKVPQVTLLRIMVLSPQVISLDDLLPVVDTTADTSSKG